MFRFVVRGRLLFVVWCLRLSVGICGLLLVGVVCWLLPDGWSSLFDGCWLVCVRRCVLRVVCRVVVCGVACWLLCDVCCSLSVFADGCGLFSKV